MRNYNFKFPTNKKIYERYWLLFWIGKLFYEKGNIKVELLFVNKKNSDNKVTDINFDLVEVIVVNISYLFEFKVGFIYDGFENKVVSFGVNSEIGYIKNVPKIYTYKTSNGNFPLSNNKYFLKDSEHILGDNYSYQSIFYKSYGREIQVLISPYIWIQFFFQSSRLIKKLFTGEIFEGLDLDRIKYYYDNSSSEKIAQLHYDQSKYKKGELYQIIPHLFLRDNEGLKFLKSISSSVLKSFYNETVNNVYPDVYIKYSNFDIEFEGKPLYNETNGIRKDYFLVSSIKSLKFSERNSYTIDKVCLVPYNSKSSTEDKENHELEQILTNSVLQSESAILILNGEGALSNTASESRVQTEQDFSSSLIIEFNKRLEQLGAYSVINEINNESIDLLSRELEGIINENNTLRENIEKEIVQIERISNFQFFQEVVTVLTAKKTISLNIELLGLRSLKEILSDFGVMIAEINYNNSYLYLIEFGISFIGVFTSINFKKLSNENLVNLIRIFKRNEANSNLQKMSLWTYLYNESIYFERNYNIIIHQGVKHLRESNLGSSPISETAERILKQRVFKILL